MQNACENTSDVKKSFPRRPFSTQSAKTTIFWTAQDGNAPPPKWWFWNHSGYGNFALYTMLAKISFRKCASCLGGEHIFRKITKKWCPNVKNAIKIMSDTSKCHQHSVAHMKMSSKPYGIKPISWKYASRLRWGALFCQPYGGAKCAKGSKMRIFRSKLLCAYL